MSAINLVFDPDEFYGDNKDTLTFRDSLRIVGLAAVVGALSPLIILYYQAQLEPDAATTPIVAGGLITVVGSVLSVFALWFAFSSMIHTIATFSRDRTLFPSFGDDFRQLFILTGFGFVCDLVSNLNNSIATFLTLRGVFSGSSPEELGTGAVAGSLLDSTAMTMTVVVTVLVLIWRWFIWSFAVKHTYGYELKKSVLIAAVPSIVNILLTVFVFNSNLI